MDGFKAFKYYTAIKLHFTSPKFNVFVNRGHVRGTYERFAARNDRMLFEKLARQFDDKEFIQYVAANFMYGNPDVIYDSADAMANYKEFLRRRQSITRIFEDDLHTVVESGAQYNFSGSKVPDVIQLLLRNKITLETVAILNEIDNIVDQTKQNAQLALMMGDTLLRIEKSKGFVKYDTDRIRGHYEQFLEDVKGNSNG